MSVNYAAIPTLEVLRRDTDPGEYLSILIAVEARIKVLKKQMPNTVARKLEDVINAKGDSYWHANKNAVGIIGEGAREVDANQVIYEADYNELEELNAAEEFLQSKLCGCQIPFIIRSRAEAKRIRRAAQVLNGWRGPYVYLCPLTADNQRSIQNVLRGVVTVMPLPLPNYDAV